MATNIAHVLALLLAACVTLGWGAPASEGRCRCVPDQWEGIMSSIDREFDLLGGHSRQSHNDMFIHYDYTRKLFAMRDVTTGNSAIADYERGYKYVIRQDGCHAMHTGETMTKMCLPDDALFIGQHTLGDGLPVEMWAFTGPFNASMRTTVTLDCIPITEETSNIKKEYASITSSMYLDVNLGIQDAEVFAPPKDCFHYPEPSRAHGGPNNAYAKRMSGGPKSFLQALHQRLHTTT